MANGQPGASSDSIFKQLESAYNSFMLELEGTSTEAQRRVFFAAQQPWTASRDAGTAQMEYQQRISEAWKDVDLPKRYLGALRDYRSAVEKVMTGIDIHALDSVALMAVSQTFQYIAMYGFWLNDSAVVSRSGPQTPAAPPIQPDPSRNASPPTPPTK